MNEYRFLAKVLYSGKLRIVTFNIKGGSDALSIIEALEEILGFEPLSATQIVSLERISDEP